jgi:ankyrin repeat protein
MRRRTWILLCLALGLVAIAPFAYRLLESKDDARARLPKAVRKGDVQAVKSIVGRFPELVNAKYEGGMTPLHQAAHEGRLDVAKLLIEKGAVVDAVAEASESTPLMIAVGWMDTSNPELVSLLLDHGANPNPVTKMKDTPLMRAAQRGTMPGKEETVKHLVEKGADVNANDKGRFGLSVLHYAAIGNNPSVVEFLIEKGAEVNARNVENETPLGMISNASQPAEKPSIEEDLNAAIKGKLKEVLLEQNKQIDRTAVIAVLKKHGGTE